MRCMCAISVSQPREQNTRTPYCLKTYNKIQLKWSLDVIKSPDAIVGKNYSSVYINPCARIWTHKLLNTKLATRRCSTVVRRFTEWQSPRTPRATVGRSTVRSVMKFESHCLWFRTQKLLCMHETARCTERSVRPSVTTPSRTEDLLTHR
jgi:hypothetical protein